MTDQEINRAIAQHCGTLRGFYCGHCREERSCEKNQRHKHHVNGKEEWFCNFCDKGPLHQDMPSYCNDLNAMAEAESLLDCKSVDEQSLYYDNLSLLVGWKSKTLEEAKWESTWNSLRAKPRQKAEAFLRTIGKWRAHE